MTLNNVNILTYPYQIDLIHTGDMPIDNFNPHRFCFGFISSITFGPVGQSSVGYVCLGLQITE